MPYIETKTNVKMTDAQKKELKAVFPSAVSMILKLNISLSSSPLSDGCISAIGCIFAFIVSVFSANLLKITV